MGRVPTIEIAGEGLAVGKKLVDQTRGDNRRVVAQRRTGLWNGEDAGVGRETKRLPVPPDTNEAPEVVCVVSDEISSCRAEYAICSASEAPDCPASTVRVTL